MARRTSPQTRQHGAALFILLLLILVGAGTVFVSRLKSADVELEAQRKTAAALAQAKQALLGYAARDANRPGSLPCPDGRDDGTSGIDDYDGSDCRYPVGRLPWKQLGLPDLRDGHNERLWYAVSPAFGANGGNLNTEDGGQITVRNNQGMVVSDSTAPIPSGSVAVILAPGAVLVRHGDVAPQNRVCGAGGCDAALVCIGANPTLIPKCNPANYLDKMNGVEDNASFTQNSADGFIGGVVREPADPDRILINDRLAAISYRELNAVVTARMAAALANENNPLPGIGALNKPAEWLGNDWDSAVESIQATAAGIALKFKNCAIVYTISNPAAVTRSPRSC